MAGVVAVGRPSRPVVSRLSGVPAVAAIVHDLKAKFPEVGKDQTARQFCGAYVADVMRRHGHEIIQPRGRVPGDTFTYGAVWTAKPVPLSFADSLQALADMPGSVSEMVRRFAVSLHSARPQGTGFALVEHVCHLRDLDKEVYIKRVSLILSKTSPKLWSVDGSVMAEERDYLSQDLAKALRGFGIARRQLVKNLAATTKTHRDRQGLFDGTQRVTLLEIVEDIYRHDKTHLLELDELAAEFGVKSA